MVQARGRMRLNCDIGESYGPWKMGSDRQVMPHIDMANLACGFHASDPDTMASTVQLAQAHQVLIGAHPGYDDKVGFGRRSIPCSPATITHLVQYQVGALQAICQLYKTKVTYVKPHGALYHDMMNKQQVFQAILRAVAVFDRSTNSQVKLMIQAKPGIELYQVMAQSMKVELLYEAFVDRAYTDQGELAPRSEDGAVFHDTEVICEQAQLLAQESVVITRSGKRLKLKADTICVHGDNPESIAVIQKLRETLA